MQVELELDEEGRIAGSPPDLRYQFRTWENILQQQQQRDSDSTTSTRTTRSTSGKQVADLLQHDCQAVYNGNDTFFLPCGMKPRCTLERLAKHIFDLHAVPPFDEKSSGAEWWVQVRQAKDTHETIGFHWDKDEDLVDQIGMNVHPQISTVTYLQDAGAPTVILEKRSSPEYGKIDPSVANTLHVSWPKRFKHVSFDGRLLHAAPASLAAANPAASKKYTRITFLVNVWLQYSPVNARVFPHEMISELGLSDVALPISFATELPPHAAKVTREQRPEQHLFPFGSTGSEHTVRLFLPRAFPAGSSLTLSFPDELGGAVTSDTKPSAKKRARNTR